MRTVKELQNLTGRNALITGASGHLGQKFAGVLAELGANLIIVDKQEVGLMELKKSLTKKYNVEITSYLCDLEDENSRELIISTIKKDFDSLSILINNAAFVGTTELEGWAVPFEQQTLSTWRRAIEVNLTAVFHLSQGLAPIIRRSTGASIVNIGSIYGYYAPDFKLYEGTNLGNPAAYAVSKAGLTQLTRWLSTALAPTIRVNSISLGGIEREQTETFKTNYVSKTPLQRMAKEDDALGALILLATDMAEYITGQNIFVDGGWGVW